MKAAEAERAARTRAKVDAKQARRVARAEQAKQELKQARRAARGEASGAQEPHSGGAE